MENANGGIERDNEIISDLWVLQGQSQVTPEFEAAHAEMPLEHPAGGDFHTAFPVNDGSGDIGVVIGDVSGHGPQAAVQAQMLKDEIVSKLAGGQSPAEALKEVNGPVEADPEFEGFATVFAGRVEADTGTVRYASGGHEPGLIAPAESSADPADVQELAQTGPPVGVMPGGDVEYGEETATLPEGGTLLLYTDGISEARARERKDWLGIERLKGLLARFAALPARRLVARILAGVFEFCGRTMRDDFVLLAIRRRHPARAAERVTIPPRHR